MDCLEFQDKINSIIQHVGNYGSKTKDQKILINTLALTGEAGEIANKIKKSQWYKPPTLSNTLQNDISEELGDVAYHLAQLATEFGLKLSDIFDNSVSKALSRSTNKL